MSIDDKLRQRLLAFQKNEITEYHIYRRLARSVPSAENRRILQVHPRRNPKNPLTGVFATRSPVRPNLIAMSTCRIESIQGTAIKIDDIDARDGTPVIDIKCYIPPDESLKNVHLPDWV